MADPTRLGRYELLERIGQGTLGVLYRSRDTLLGREVAVKVMAAGFHGDETAQARFFREAKSAARLQHVNIVTMFEFGEHEQTPFIVMEFLRGFSLVDRLRKQMPMPLREKLDVAIQLCAGLEAAHKQGVVHRDVKPGNVWICLDGTVKLLDFGIAAGASSNATIIDVLGSPGYMSPEQIAGTPVDARTDIFSAGVVLYEMLTGRRPFEADSPTGVMLKIVNDPASPIVDSEIPPALRTAVAKALEKSPAARYARASDLGRDLKAIKANLKGPPESATVMIDRTTLHLPSDPTVARTAGRTAARTPDTVVSRLRGVDVRSPLFIGIAAAVILASGVLGWYAFSRPPAAPGPSPAAPPGAVKPAPAAPASTTSTQPASTPSSVPASSTVTLQVTSRPPGARVIVDGADTGRTTPAQVSFDRSRPPARIQLALQGFRPEEAAVSPETVKRGSLDVPLSPLQVARVSLLASGDYEFEVLGRQRVLSPAATRHDVVVSGLQSVQLRSTRYFLDQAVRVDRASGGRVEAVAPPLGTITVYAAGVLEDCKVYIDDRIVDSGSLPITNREIASGAHRVQLKCTRGDTDAQTVTVPPREGFTTRFGANTPLRLR
jgi:serine/threonine protein kinase